MSHVPDSAGSTIGTSAAVLNCVSGFLFKNCEHWFYGSRISLQHERIQSILFRSLELKLPNEIIDRITIRWGRENNCR